jgi:hypothetical protein
VAEGTRPDSHDGETPASQPGRHLCRKLMIGSSAAQPAQRWPTWHPRGVRVVSPAAAVRRRPARRSAPGAGLLS